MPRLLPRLLPRILKAFVFFQVFSLWTLSFSWKAYILETPPEYSSGFGLGISGDYLCGWARKNTQVPEAVLYSSGREAFLYKNFQFYSIHPSNSFESYAVRVSNGFVVGKSRQPYDPRVFHAVVWYDLPTKSVLDIHAWGKSSEAIDASGFYILMNTYGDTYSQPLLYDWVFQQTYKPLSSFQYSLGTSLERNPLTGEYVVGGVVLMGTEKVPLGFVWKSKGNVKEEINLNPEGAIESSVQDVSIVGGETACGYAVFPGNNRYPQAVLWNGLERENAIVISPPGSFVSIASGITGTIAVGTFWQNPLTPKAFVTFLNPNNSYVDLNAIAESSKSMATKVFKDPFSGKIMISGFVYKSGKTSPVIWTNE